MKSQWLPLRPSVDNPSLNPLSRRSQADSKIYLFSSLEASFVYHHWLSQKTPHQRLDFFFFFAFGIKNASSFRTCLWTINQAFLTPKPMTLYRRSSRYFADSKQGSPATCHCYLLKGYRHYIKEKPSDSLLLSHWSYLEHTILAVVFLLLSLSHS